MPMLVAVMHRVSALVGLRSKVTCHDLDEALSSILEEVT